MFEAFRINIRQVVRTQLKALVVASKKDLGFWRERPYLQNFVPLGWSTSQPNDENGGVSVQMIDAEMLTQPRASFEHFFVVHESGRQIGHVGLFGDTPFKLLQRLETKQPRYATHFVQVIYYSPRRVAIVVWSIPRGYSSTYHYCLELVNQAGLELVQRRKEARSERPQDEVVAPIKP